MSTNYFWKQEQKPGATTLPTGPAEVELDPEDPRLHVGKSYWGEHGYSFLWAQEPADVRAACERAQGGLVVVNEYGAELSGSQFIELMSLCSHNGMRWIGVRFC